ncbi:exopolysaccharide biosynthesis protein [Methanosphaera cuniculi]|uniref:exopolysaccharide biosynthesis protein n=1 Tax=Methanosphaera cuniculi TaxID=1077256 RepID=UPI0026EBE2D7|nr:exopolysaccharide biosynthesis protein [Methanosphaera cuniculi]
MNELQVIKYENTSDKIKHLKSQLPEGKMTLKEFFNFYDTRELIMILLIAPFLIPFSIPGSSTPFGILIILLALGEIFNRRFYLPNFVGNHELSHDTVEKLFNIIIKALGYIEKIVKPRGKMVKYPKVQKINLFMCILLSILLFLPLPIPFTDFFPAASMLLLLVSNIENDSYLMILGYVMSIVTFIYFYNMGSLGIEIILQVINYALSYIH